MKIDWRIVQAEPEHINGIVKDMRDIDKYEVWSSHRLTALEALSLSFANASKAWTCLAENKPVMMFGVNRINDFQGMPWLLASNGVDLVKKKLLKQSKIYVSAMQRLFPFLENYVHAKNSDSIKWLRWCGFKIADELIYINDEPFYYFWRVGKCAPE